MNDCENTPTLIGARALKRIEDILCNDKKPGEAEEAEEATPEAVAKGGVNVTIHGGKVVLTFVVGDKSIASASFAGRDARRLAEAIRQGSYKAAA